MKKIYLNLYLGALLAILLLLLAPVAAQAQSVGDDSDLTSQCIEGARLILDGQYAEALPLLEARFANQEAFASPNELGACAAILGQLRENAGDLDGALQAYTVASEALQATDNQLLVGQAIERYVKALVNWREIGDRDKEGTALNEIGFVYYKQGRYDLALEQYQQALEIRRQIGDRFEEGITLNRIANVYGQQGRYDLALEQYQQALEIRRQIGDRAGEGATLHNIGTVYGKQGRYDLALEQYQQALEITRQVGDRAGEGATLSSIGTVYDKQGRYDLALEQYQQALDIEREVGRISGTNLSNIGVVYLNQGRLDMGLKMFEQALSIIREVGDRSEEGTTLNNIGGVYSNQGRLDMALEMFEQALSIMRELGDRFGEAMTLNNIGKVYFEQGRLNMALESYQQALAIKHQVGNISGQGTILNNIGAVYSNQGRLNMALESYQQALAIAREVGDRPGEGGTLTSIGTIYLDQERLDAALESLMQALDIQREVGHRLGEATTLHNIGSVYLSQGRFDTALEMFQQALAIRREVGNRSGEGVTLNNIGGIYLDQGRLDMALEMFQQALSIMHEVGNRSGEGTTLNNIAYVYSQQNEPTQALAYYEEAMTVLESVRAVAGSESGRASFIAQHAGLYNDAALLYLLQGQHAEAFFTSERARARSFLDSLSTGYVQLADNEAQDLFDKERDAYGRRLAIQDALAKARALNPPDDELVADLERQLADAEQVHAQALAAIEARGDQLADLVPGRNRVLTVSEVQAELDEQTTLVSYYMVSDDEALAFVITRDEFRTVPLPVGRAKLFDDISLFRDVGNAHLDTTHPESLQRLYDSLIAPLAPHLSTPTLAIVPHDVLHYLPFAALHDGQTYLVDQYALSILPSASVLRFVQENAEKSSPLKNSLLIGNPATNLIPLSFAEQEVETIAKLYGASPLVGAAATEETFRAKAEQANLIHVAAHGKYNSDNPLFSTLHLAASEAHDGRMEVEEIYSLDLQHAHLVVLSACETQLPVLTANKLDQTISAGDEIVALNRALLYAGTPTVIATLWQVDDETTALLMERFYTHLQAGRNLADALRQAQQEVRNDSRYAHPYYWAAFVLTGDAGEGEDELNATQDALWLPIGGGLALLLVIASSGMWIWRRRTERRGFDISQN